MASPELRLVNPTHARRTVIGLIAAVVALFGLATPAFAHAELVSATPAVGSTTSDSPGVIVLNFNEDIDATAKNVISVIGPMGDEVAIGNTRVSGPVAEVDVATFADEGSYVVSYRVISADGHEVKSSYAFDYYLDAGASAPADAGNAGGDPSAEPKLMSKPLFPATDATASATAQPGTPTVAKDKPAASHATRWVILGVFVAALLAASKALRTYRRKRLRPDAPDEQ